MVFDGGHHLGQAVEERVVRGLGAQRYCGATGALLPVALFVVSIYVGYFGAAGGILMLAVLAGFLDQSPAGLNAAKNMLSGLANAVAGLGFTLFGPVDWGAAVPLAAGFLLGGWLGPKIVRRMPGQSSSGRAVRGRRASGRFRRLARPSAPWPLVAPAVRLRGRCRSSGRARPGVWCLRRTPGRVGLRR
ncbi:sulfite exporter TauE/SafE family protein [Nonomuraea sp. NPDC050680]|uniref:sulfite exporter TauE/SafE family protein n=1 Tax=Nonomuraea sp. NPDC050680 TaxID=3154630 RepID=UPI0033D258ED